MGEEKTKLISRDFVLTMTAVVGTSFVNYFFFSTMALFSDTLTGTAAYAGYLSMVYSITALIVRPLSGLIADKYSRVKLIIAGAALCAVTCLLYSFTTGLILLLIIRAINGAGMSMNQIGAGAAIPDIVPKEKLTQGIGIHTLTSTIAQALGPMIAIAIVADGAISSFRTLFLVAAVFCSVSFISGCFVRYEREQGKKRAEYSLTSPPGEKSPMDTEQSESLNTDREVVKVKTILGVEPPAIILFFILFLYFLGMAGILSFTTLYAKTRGFRIEYIGLFYFIISGGIFIARLLLGRVVDKRGGDIIVIPCTIIVAICLFLIPRAPSLLILICLALPYGIANGAVVPALNAALFKRCSPNRRGAVSATYFIAVDLGITVGTPVMGLIVDHIDFSWVYWLSAIFSGMSVLLYVLFGSDMQYERRQKKKRSHGTAIV